MAYAIKTIPEDFYVKEIINLKIEEKGSFAYCLLKKIGFPTIEAVEFISKKLNIPRKNINFAGTKDKKAVTEQAVSIRNWQGKDFDFGKIKLEFLGYGNEPVNLGSNEGNYFEIIIRNIEKRPKERKWLINYFDDQRFSENNVDVGRAIVKRDFRKAAEILRNETVINGNDFIGALRIIDKKILTLYVNAYQSYLWNKCVSRIFEKQENRKIGYSLGELVIPDKKPKQSKYPLIGFGTGEDDIKEILEEEKITPREFIIREIPELSSEGTLRNVVVEVKDLKIGDLESDELNKGKKKIKICFTLPKGCYATMFLKQLFLE